MFFANAVWLGLAVIAHNLGRWTLQSAGVRWARATVATLKAKLIAMPARLVHKSRRLLLRAPTGWPWAEAYRTAMARIAAIPAPT